MSQLGVTYAWGGGDENGPTLGIRDGGVADSYGDYNKVGFDCSGLMIYAFAGIGISLPHYTGYQYTAGEQVPSSQMKRGDMVFYGPNASQHVALYLGNGEMIEAPQSGSVVKVSPLRWDGMTPYVVRMVS
ncbi:NlpC/P60 family protein [Rhodococcus sp. NPDC003318]|uniref:NlpC/P60 family protein n=1 Tax=Rhodococcus sp. NPDC003318 TaxID=3364503 RepID=UPI0036A45A2A